MHEVTQVSTLPFTFILTCSPNIYFRSFFKIAVTCWTHSMQQQLTILQIYTLICIVSILQFLHGMCWCWKSFHPLLSTKIMKRILHSFGMSGTMPNGLKAPRRDSKAFWVIYWRKTALCQKMLLFPITAIYRVWKKFGQLGILSVWKHPISPNS